MEDEVAAASSSTPALSAHVSQRRDGYHVRAEDEEDQEVQEDGAALRDEWENDDDEQEEAAHERDRYVKERRVDARRKRIRLLNELLRDVDMVIYMELMTVYYLDSSFFWLAVKALIHGTLLTPTPDTPTLDRPPDEPKPFLPLLLFSFAAPFVLHLASATPAAGEDTRGYLHGGLMIDFIGQQPPASRVTLAALDACILLLQVMMVSVHVKRRDLKKKLAALLSATAAAREQDADDEERGVLHRTDTLSDAGAEAGGEGQDDEEQQYQHQQQQHQRPHQYDAQDALDMLTSGQCVVADLTLVDTLMHENRNYSAYRLTHSETAANDMPETLRRLNTLRTRFGVGG